ncbi:MAG: lyase family protein [Leifsonia sp.]
MTDPGFDWGLLEPLGAPAVASTSDDALLAALVEVERALVLAWAGIDAESGDGSRADASSIAAALRSDDLDRAALLAGARTGGVPVIALVEQLRSQAEAAVPGSGVLVHLGATSQDILDSAIVLIARRSLRAVRAHLAATGRQLARLADDESSTVCLARTLGQHAEPTTAGAQVAGWLDGISSAIGLLDAVRFPLQLGGAIGTGLAFEERMAGATRRLRASVAAELGLDDPERAWHTDRTPVLAIAEAAAAATAVTARLGREVAFLARTDIGEVRLGRTGGSSAMPHKRNPVDAVLLTANGLRAPGLLSTVHVAAVSQDARPPGEWHAEWQAVRGLLRLAVESADAAELLAGDISVDHDAVRRTIASSADLVRDPELVIAVSDGIVRSAIIRFHSIEEAGR